MHGVCGYICMVIVVISGCMHGNSSAMFKLVRADTKASKEVCPSVHGMQNEKTKQTYLVGAMLGRKGMRTTVPPAVCW